MFLFFYEVVIDIIFGVEIREIDEVLIFGSIGGFRDFEGRGVLEACIGFRVKGSCVYWFGRGYIRVGRVWSNFNFILYN